MKKLALLFLTCFLLLQNCPPLAAQEDKYIIGLGDILEILVWKEPDLSRQVRVRLDGRISLPLTGDVMAAGKSPRELAREIETSLKKYIAEPAASVILTESTSRRYYVIGLVNKPGEFPIDYPITVLQAIARAGGFQEWAKRENIVIVRRTSGQEKLIPFNYETLVKGANLRQNLEVAPGDTIIVP